MKPKKATGKAGGKTLLYYARERAEPPIRVLINFSRPMLDALDRKAIERGTTRTAVVHSIISAYFEREGE
jgi:hypothetical protein